MMIAGPFPISRTYRSAPPTGMRLSLTAASCWPYTSAPLMQIAVANTRALLNVFFFIAPTYIKDLGRAIKSRSSGDDDGGAIDGVMLHCEESFVRLVERKDCYLRPQANLCSKLEEV